MKYEFKHIHPNQEIWTQIEASTQSTCFHTKEWYAYLKKIGYHPYMISVSTDNTLVGYFIGERIWRGVWLLTSPFEGIGTYTQGLVLLGKNENGELRTENGDMRTKTREEERVEIYRQLAEWAFANHVAVYLQVDDWQLRRDSAEWIPYEVFKQDVLERLQVKYEFRPTLYLDMGGKTEEELWSMQHYKSCKYSVNKARKLGLYVRQITEKEEIAAFCKRHYAQLHEVCVRKGMTPKPSQAEARMRALCEALFPYRVIMMECIGKDENGEEVVMSTGIFCPDKGESIYWTGASYQRYQKCCPNELMVWEAIRLLQQRGAGGLNFGGMADYKLKFGTIYAYVPRLIFTKYQWIYQAKTAAKQTYHGIRNGLAKWVKKRKK